MSQDNIIRLQSSVSKYMTISRKNRKKLAQHKIEVMKYDPTVRKRVKFKEVKWKGKG